ncbi:MAG: methyltransferase domain-containing protein [Candidatus Margulisbacteria bacterium]|nr:methyltransferase domain-containing protein [Candidatus Margulisiibacteriota bacterium]
MNKPPVSDYSTYNYQTYWTEHDRRYENLCERQTLSKLLSQYPPSNTILDAGCGFGRLFPIYEPFAKEFYLLDYANNLLSQAKKSIHHPQVTFLKGNMYEIPLKNNTVNTVISIRTLHHLKEPAIFFKEVYRVLDKNGYFIFECPNKKHLLQIARLITGKSHYNPFSKVPLERSHTFYNFHPKYIDDLLIKQSFETIKILNTSFFRSPFIKKKISPKKLASMDAVFQSFFSRLNLTPSIFYLVKKRHP